MSVTNPLFQTFTVTRRSLFLIYRKERPHCKHNDWDIHSGVYLTLSRGTSPKVWVTRPEGTIPEGKGGMIHIQGITSFAVDLPFSRAFGIHCQLLVVESRIPTKVAENTKPMSKQSNSFRLFLDT